MRRAGTAVALAAALLTGCGGGGGSANGGKPVTLRPGQPLTVSAREYRFDPNRVTAPAGRLALTLHNAGSLAHDIRVEQGGRELGGTPIITPGQDARATVNLSPGTYDFICTVGDHAQLGMKGTLTVK
jgi:plastocyanin